eukprot:1162147-Pelagomonas_calceolata.AAC.10
MLHEPVLPGHVQTATKPLGCLAHCLVSCARKVHDKSWAWCLCQRGGGGDGAGGDLWRTGATDGVRRCASAAAVAHGLPPCPVCGGGFSTGVHAGVHVSVSHSVERDRLRGHLRLPLLMDCPLARLRRHFAVRMPAQVPNECTIWGK